MADFLPNLWSSVFTPGTTPTLLIATNATFAALQLLLATLLITTYSIHFAILSVLCGGLWWSINWFATELQAAQAKEDEADQLRKRKKGESEWRSKGEVGDSADDEGEDTEVEGSGPASGTKESANPLSGEVQQDDSRSSGAATGAEQAVGGAEARQRRAEEVDRSGEISTDSEWEKVSQEGDR
ncbi:SMK killer toxin resistance protein [Vermiconidia calcicola]|uniref:SMK killer toxin resistance protein n=1 Tax=Vermiconidia calcicola TaxID=1690605 RepID=A0ACC3MT75_9PEZI|nr:SMK killer toxin resistance protein [Vermiconidia calcicola]